MELGTIRQINIDSEMQASYLDYAMSVIVARALPDVRDGLKPVHRRILYAMHDLGLEHDKPYKKSARIVGEVLGKYHPHGDAAVYEAMVRMAQDFSLRYPLVDGQGNFGSIDGDNAAAMRYTEARLAAISEEMLADIQKDTVDWVDNFDGTLKEPAVLPAALPNLIVNGSSGIAVGMSTNIPPHNLGEVCDAVCYLIDNHQHIEDVTVEDLMRFIPGPDFPTGGVIYRYVEETNGNETEQVDVIARAYAGGKGRIVVQAKAHIEEMTRNRSRIVVSELPYQTDKSNLIERIAELVRDGRLEGITDLRDESDRTGMRLCIEMTRTVEPRDVLAELFKLTPLQSTFGVSLLALVDGEPRHLSLKRILQHYIEHRQEVIVRRSRYDLEKARQRAHILEGLLRALDILDEVIALIRRSRTADTAKQHLIEQFKFTEIQAQAILDMQLRRLAALERRKLEEEFRATLALIKELEELLASPAKVLALIRRNLTELKARYGDARRTQIADRTKGALTAKDVLPDQEVWLTLSVDGMVSRISRVGSKHPLIASREASPGWCLPVNTRQDLYLFSAKGQSTRVPVYQVPDGASAHYADLSGLTRRDRIVAACAFPQLQGDELLFGYLLLGTTQGKVKRVALVDLAAQAHTNPQVIGLDSGDELAWADVSLGGGEILLVTAAGQAIRFAEEDVRPMGLQAGGIGGIKLQGKDRVVAGFWIGRSPEPEGHAGFLTAGGYGKRVPLSEFPIQGRNGQGVIAVKPNDRAGDVVGAVLAAPRDFVICLRSAGRVTVLRADALPEMARAAQGKPVLQLLKGEQITQTRGALGLLAEPEPAPEPQTQPRRAAARPRVRSRPEEPALELPMSAAAARKVKAEAAPRSREPETSAVTRGLGTTRHPAPTTAPKLAPASPKAEAPEPLPKVKPSAAKPAAPTSRGAETPAVAPRSREIEASAEARGLGTRGPGMTKAQAKAELVPKGATPALVEVEPEAPKSVPKVKRHEPKARIEKGGTLPAPGAPAKDGKPAAAVKKTGTGGSAEKSSTQPARREAAPAEDISVKEMKGRSISRADLEKLIRGEITELPSSAESVGETKRGSPKPPAGSSTPVKVAPAPASKAARKPSSKPPPKETASTPATKSKSGSASRKPPTEPASPAEAKATPADRPKPGDTASKPPARPSGSPSKAAPAEPASGAGKQPLPKPKSGTAAGKPPAQKKTKP